MQTHVLNSQAEHPLANYVAYYRVATRAQWASGLGLKAQQDAVRAYAAKGNLVAEYRECASGTLNERPVLQEAIDKAKEEQAVLLVEYVECLSRDACFVMSGIGVKFIAVDLGDADGSVIAYAALFAQKENDRIRKRTREALAQAKARGVKLGNPRPQEACRKGNAVVKHNAAKFREKLRPIIKEIQKQTVKPTYAYIADELNRQGVRGARGGKFHPSTVQRLLV